MVNFDLCVNFMVSEFFTPDGLTVNPAIQQWPFPTQDNPLKPWTPEKEKEYRDSLNEDAPF